MMKQTQPLTTILRDVNARLLAIVGETASGKSVLAMQIARAHGGEIVCADAWTVYPGFDIGAAKPSETDRLEVPHHLLDVADPTTGFSVAAFQQRAYETIAGIIGRGKLPILVGGSGLYVDSVLYQYSFTLDPNRYERDVLNTMSVAELLLLAESRGLDTAGIDSANKRRVLRLIERGGQVAGRAALPHGVCIIGIRPSRDDLESRVKNRVDRMIAAGLEDEVGALAARYRWGSEAMKGIGYREWRAYFDGSATRAETRERIVRSTMQLAKKQRTWFRRNPDIHWFSDPAAAEQYAVTWLQ